MHTSKLSKRRGDVQASIARRVRQLRLARQWTQADLSRRLGLSQGRLSEIERGGGSFTAEQFLLILQLFNVGVSDFSVVTRDAESEIQNVLARLGALHLQERADVLPSEQVEAVTDAVREALAIGAPRILTALAPVLARHADRVNLNKLRSDLVGAGLERRLDWLVDNTVEALRQELAHGQPPRSWAQRYRRALLVLETFATFVHPNDERPSSTPGTYAPDILDPHIRSKQTLEEVKASSSPSSERWGIVTSLQPNDFVHALRAARASG
jgi:transcriptional regulator with XRE-family HTH domain